MWAECFLFAWILNFSCGINTQTVIEALGGELAGEGDT